MAKQIDKVQANHWHDIAIKLQQAKTALDEAELILLLQLKETNPKPLERIREAENALSGLSYLFTPQTEWTGGDSSKPQNFKFTEPHIIR